MLNFKKNLATEICRETIYFEKLIYQFQKHLERVKTRWNFRISNTQLFVGYNEEYPNLN